MLWRWSRRRAYLAAVVPLLAFVGLVYLGVDLWTAESPNYSLVADRLYLGGYVEHPPPGTRAVLNLCESADPYQLEVQSWQPIPDAEPAPSIDWLRQRVDFIHVQRQAGEGVYVHCRNGVSRSAMVVVAYVMLEKKWPRDRALAFVRSKRPVVRPNPAFMHLLSEWERVVLGDGDGAERGTARDRPSK